MQLNAHYVWSKALDNNGGDGQNIWNFADRDATPWGRADFDRRHQFVLTWVWELPDFRRVRTLNRVLSGWQINQDLVDGRVHSRERAESHGQCSKRRCNEYPRPQQAPNRELSGSREPVR